jgi:hypothetical protein
MTNVLLVEFDVKSIATNIALMKYASWCEQHKYNYKYVVGEVDPCIVPDLMIFSCIFSFNAEKYEKTISYYKSMFPNAEVLIGGPFPTNNPEWFRKTFPYAKIHEGINPEIENLPMKYSLDPSNKKMVMYASRGCPNKCGYCAVPRLEGNMRSFESIQHLIDNGKREIVDPTGIVLYDNNFTAHEHIDKICDELERSGLPIDIHGLHASSFTEHHAERFARLKWKSQHEKGTAYMRFSFDFMGYKNHLLRSLKLCEKHKIKAGFFCYMLFNWKDTPDDFWKRIELAQEMVDEVGRTIFLFPQRYEPLDSLKRNKFVGEHWTDDLVRGTVKTYTYLHGFLPVTKSRNLYNWIGSTKEEFFDNVMKFAKNPKYRLKKLGSEEDEEIDVVQDLSDSEDISEFFS